MSVGSSIGVFATTLQKTHEWLERLRQIGNYQDQPQAYTALRAVLHALRDRLIVDEAADLGAQLPMLIRGVYYEGWNPSATPVKQRSAEEFVMTVHQSLRNATTTIDAQGAVKAVFRLLNEKVTQGEIEDVRQMLPRDLQDWWP